MDGHVVGALLSAAVASVGLNACTSSMDGDTESASSAKPAAASGSTASARLVDAGGMAKGTATARPMGDGIHVDATITGMKPGIYGIHVHTTGTCTAPTFESAGGHWNPTKAQHGTENPMGAHKGDFRNITIGADGSGKISSHVSGATISGGSAALLDADGAAIIVHAAADDYKTDPSGNSGARMACGVFSAG